ncbi:MAG: cell division protein ZapA [Candidatus Pelagibacter sp.]
MANVNIIFNGKEFLLSCEDGQEEHLQELSAHLNEKFDNLKKSLGNIGESKLLLITSITTMDEYFETKKKIDDKIKELNVLTSKFKELKNLVYEYKEKKEEEIRRLDGEQVKLKNEIDQNKDDYEKLIDSTTNEIENFLKKASTDNSVQ